MGCGILLINEILNIKKLSFCEDLSNGPFDTYKMLYPE